MIFHINEITHLKVCNRCKFFLQTSDFSISGICTLFKNVNLVSADKEFVNAIVVRQDQNLCGKDAKFFKYAQQASNIK